MKAPSKNEGLLDGGVASDLRIENRPGGPVVIKRALAKLRVAADWFANPDRSLVEVAALRTIARLLGPAVVPEVLSVDAADNSFTMRLIDPRFVNWKRELMAGRVDPATATAVGALLGRLHCQSAADPSLAAMFNDMTHFEELRIKPFFERAAVRNPQLRRAIDCIVKDLRDRRSALVHGDYSPKNLLVDGSEVVILDCEVAHWGDPRFDVAFCLSHLLLKAHLMDGRRDDLFAGANAFFAGYRSSTSQAIDTAMFQITGCLLLARLDGDSPVDYVADLDEHKVRQLATILIGGTVPGAEKLITILSEQQYA